MGEGAGTNPRSIRSRCDAAPTSFRDLQETTGHKRAAPPLLCRPMWRPRTGRAPGTAVNRLKIWRRPSLSAYVQTGARWLLGSGSTTGTPALTGDARRFTDEWSYPAQDHDNLECRFVALAWRLHHPTTIVLAVMLGCIKFVFPKAPADRIFKFHNPRLEAR